MLRSRAEVPPLKNGQKEKRRAQGLSHPRDLCCPSWDGQDKSTSPALQKGREGKGQAGREGSEGKQHSQGNSGHSSDRSIISQGSALNLLL